MYDLLKRIDNELNKLGHKRPWLSKTTGISLNTINGWFTHNRPPRVDYAYEIAKALGVSVEYLITGKESYRLSKDPKIQNLCEYLQSQNESEIDKIIAILKAVKYIQLSPEMNIVKLENDDPKKENTPKAL